MIILRNMKKKNKILLIILLLITACIFCAVTLYFGYIKHPKKEPYVIKPFQLNSIDSQTYSSSKLELRKDLEILPNNFSEIIEKNNLNISNKNIIELLRYGQTVVDFNKELPIDLFLQNLSDSNTPLIVNNQLLSLYFLSQFENAKKEFVENEIKNKLPQAIEILKTKNLLLSKISLVKEDRIKKIDNAIFKCDNKRLEENIPSCFDSLNDLESNSFAFLNTNQKEYFNKIKDIYSILYSYKLDLKNNLSDNDTKIVDEFVSNSENKRDTSKNSSISELSGLKIKYYISNELLSKLSQYVSYLGEEFQTINYQNKTVSQLRSNLEAIQTTIANYNKEEILPKVYYFPLEQIKVRYSRLLLSVINESGEDIIGISPFIEKLNVLPQINNNNIAEDYDVPPLPIVSGRFRIPILMYHHIGTTQNISHKGLYVSPEVFEKQVAYLVKKNYKIIDTNELNSILLSGKQPTQKTIMITFDDSSPTHYSAAFPILKKYKQKGVFFVIATRSFLSVARLKEMSEAGMDIQSHSSTHVDFSKTTSERIASEIRSSKAILEGITGKPVRALAFPGCLGDARAFEILGSSGYSTAYSCGKQIDIAYNNRFYISRVHVFDDMDSFTKMISVGL